MFGENQTLGGYGAIETMAKQAQPATMRQRLDQAVVDAKRNYEDAIRAKEIFEEFPELEELINLMNRMRY